MEMEDRWFSDFYRNSSEELFLKTMMENPVGMPVPSMERLGFKSVPQNFRTDSEELFKHWLTNGELQSYNASSIGHSSRPSQRRSNELAILSNQQHVGLLSQKRSTDKLYTKSNSAADDVSGDFNQYPIRDAVDRELQASNLFLAKAWFLSDQPMTRSRSSELRRMYAATQNAPTPLGMEALHNGPQHGVNTLKQEFSDINGFNHLSTCEIPNQRGTFLSPSNSSSSTFNIPQMGDVDKVSSCVSMLRGTLEHKKLSFKVENEAFQDSSNDLYAAQEVMANTSFIEGEGNQIYQNSRTFQDASVKDHGFVQRVEGSLDADLEGFVNLINPIHPRTASREPSLSESSAAAPGVSSGFDACDGPSNSSQTLTNCESSCRKLGASRSSENGYKVKDFRGRIMDNLKDDRKRGSLDRYGSVTSAVSVDKGDATKKSRVERSRKMAEAKERNLTPSVPSDMQAVLKRCENLEKEVRSLKLNLSFMNRKDSEQTKQIEELQKQNEDMLDEKDRLLEEVGRMLSETGKI
ncbi:Protein CYCLOPS [Quillaja saponaria]|uniref:Protein CYCLOPS n=1 Tax=Quillaja saponaria TaxID=32244 RepID=A0AAD7P6J5_QUISA|nr:Protein CYCLOPS [Quillaja saponaria]